MIRFRLHLVQQLLFIVKSVAQEFFPEDSAQAEWQRWEIQLMLIRSRREALMLPADLVWALKGRVVRRGLRRSNYYGQNSCIDTLL